VGVPYRSAHDLDLAGLWTLFSLFRYLAADHQHGNDGHNISCRFLIQNTQNRDAKAIHLKLDEIIKSIDKAHNEMIDIEHLYDSVLLRLDDSY
jgi:hypothetical protein